MPTKLLIIAIRMLTGCAWNKPYWNMVNYQPTHETRVLQEYCETQW